MDERKRERLKNFRRHEAIRMANKNHQVFLSAHLRQQIQQLLRGDVEIPDLNDEGADDNRESPEDETLDDGEAYVLERLHNEGFTKRQVRTALQSTNKSMGSSEDQWDRLYEECLQWLCIHLDEDQLPEGFDPRGGTLDVIVAGKPGGDNAKNNKTAANNNGESNIVVSKDISDFAAKYGITNREAELIVQKADRERFSREDMLWQILQLAAETSLEKSTKESKDNSEALQEEIEALEAIYPSEFKVEKDGILTMLTLHITDVDTDMTMEVVVEDGLYPAVWPKRLLLLGKWPPAFGAAVHVEIIKYLSTMDLGNAFIFEVYGHVQTLFHSISSGEIKPLSLLSALVVGDTPSSKPATRQQTSDSESKARLHVSNPPKQSTSSPREVHMRPRERSVFWSSSPTKTPPATAFPKIRKSMDQARKSLPAFKARNDFLAAIAKAEQVRN
jgi:hypothetical protein